MRTGRPATSQAAIEKMLRKLHPYLEYGISINKACKMAEIPKSTVYDLIQNNKDFSEIICDTRKLFITKVHDAIYMELKLIIDKQEQGDKISPDDRKFLQWIATKHKDMGKTFSGEQIVIPTQNIDLNNPQIIHTLLRTAELIRETEMQTKNQISPEPSHQAL